MLILILRILLERNGEGKIFFIDCEDFAEKNGSNTKSFLQGLFNTSSILEKKPLPTEMSFAEVSF